jgi:RND family efflux transporter MFP subunit
MIKIKLPVRTYIILFVLCSFASCKDDSNPYTVKLQNINESVYASGTIKPRTYISIKSNTTDYISRIYVKEGDMVNIGDTLLTCNIENDLNRLSIIRLQIDKIQNDLNNKSSILKNILLEKESMKKRLDISENNVIRHKELSDIEAISKKSYDESILDFEKNKVEYTNLCNKYDEKKKQLTNDLLELEKEYYNIASQLESKIFISPISGKVCHIEKNRGDYIQPGTSILSIGYGNEYIIQLLVDERDINKVKENQKVLFNTEVFYDSIFTASIKSINPVFDLTTRNFKVEAVLQTDFPFYSESFVEANIVVRESENIIAIPVEYLHEGDSILKNEITNKVSVKVGLRNDKWCEIISGLTSGDVIFVKK